jgi:CheY-like chemotaxis protein
MSGELVSLRMLFVAPAQTDAAVWQQGSARAFFPVEFMFQDPATATSTLARGDVDIIVLDAALPDAYKAGVAQASRQAVIKPAVFICGGAAVEGTESLPSRPGSLDEARRLTNICIRAKIPTRALIVDDSSTMRSIVRKILMASRFPMDIHEAHEGIAALQQLKTGNFGIVFLDYNMPGLNGFETLSEIRREIPGVAVVMITSSTDPAMADRARAAGAFAFLKKPFFPADIDAILERYFTLAAAN